MPQQRPKPPARKTARPKSRAAPVKVAAIETVDGRVTRGQATRARLVDATRRLMSGGVLRPDANDIAREAGVSYRNLYMHFQGIHILYSEALEDHDVAGKVVKHVLSLPDVSERARRIVGCT